jgi:hypothetical protein
MVLSVALALAVGLLLVPGSASDAVDEPPLRPTPQAACNKASQPETAIQGRVPRRDYTSGRAAAGYTCNTRMVSRFGKSGGFKVFRYVDRAGRTCAVYDSTLLFPVDVPFNIGREGTGTVVLNMRDPRKPRRTANLVTPAMQSPHESLYLNKRRGLLAAAWGNAATAPGQVDIYDLKQDCRTPRLLSSTPVAGLGHESGFAPDGRTFYVASTAGQTLTAIDVSRPATPVPIATKLGVNYHGLRLSPDGRTMYVAEIGNTRPGGPVAVGGLAVLDVSSIQDREPLPAFRQLSSLDWRQRSIPQAADPVLIKGRRYVLEADEFANVTLGPELALEGGYQADAPVGASRLIDVHDPTAPRVVSNLRLAVHQLANRKGPQRNDPGAQSPVQGYAGHYCSVPRYRNPGIVACSMIASGLRIFDVRDPLRPVEVGYHVQPAMPGETPGKEGAYAMSAPAYDLKRRMVWYSDGNSGFHAVRLAKKIVPRRYWR